MDKVYWCKECSFKCAATDCDCLCHSDGYQFAMRKARQVIEEEMQVNSLSTHQEIIFQVCESVLKQLGLE